MSFLTRIACATALAGLLFASPASAQNKKVVLSQAFQSMLYLPLYVAINEGFFTAQGLDLTKETAGSPTVALSAVISGSAQFSIHGPEWTAIAASKGAPVGIIANVVNGAAVWLAAAPDFDFKDIKSLKDLEGGTLGYFINLTPTAGAMLDAAGADVDQIELIKMTNYDPTVVLRGQVDAVVVVGRSEERRVGKECSAVCRSRWSPYH